MDESTRNDIFLSPRPSFALMTAALLIGVSLKELKKEIEDGAIVAVSTRMGQRISKEEMMAVAMRLWDLATIEEALGDEAASVLPEAIRLVELHARIPRYQREMLRWFAKRDETTVDVVLSRELEDVACAHSEELASAVPGFASALGLARIDLRSGRFEASMLRFGPSMLHFEPSMLRFEPSMLRFEPSMLHFEPSMLRFEPSMLRFESSMLHFEPSMLRFESSMLRFESSMLHFESSMLRFESSMVCLEASMLCFESSMLCFGSITTGFESTDAYLEVRRAGSANGLNLRSRGAHGRNAGVSPAGSAASSQPNGRLAQVLCYQRDSRVCRFGSEDAAGPAGETPALHCSLKLRPLGWPGGVSPPSRTQWLIRPTPLPPRSATRTAHRACALRPG